MSVCAASDACGMALVVVAWCQQDEKCLFVGRQPSWSSPLLFFPVQSNGVPSAGWHSVCHWTAIFFSISIFFFFSCNRRERKKRPGHTGTGQQETGEAEKKREAPFAICHSLSCVFFCLLDLQKRMGNCEKAWTTGLCRATFFSPVFCWESLVSCCVIRKKKSRNNNALLSRRSKGSSESEKPYGALVWRSFFVGSVCLVFARGPWPGRAGTFAQYFCAKKK